MKRLICVSFEHRAALATESRLRYQVWSQSHTCQTTNMVRTFFLILHDCGRNYYRLILLEFRQILTLFFCKLHVVIMQLNTALTSFGRPGGGLDFSLRQINLQMYGFFIIVLFDFLGCATFWLIRAGLIIARGWLCILFQSWIRNILRLGLFLLLLACWLSSLFLRQFWEQKLLSIELLALLGEWLDRFRCNRCIGGAWLGWSISWLERRVVDHILVAWPLLKAVCFLVFVCGRRRLLVSMMHFIRLAINRHV